MATIFDAATRTDLIARLQRIEVDIQPLWGTFTAPRMLWHVNEAVEYGLNSTFQGRAKGPMAMWPLNKLVIHKVHWPEGKAVSPPEFLSGETTDWKAGMAGLVANLEALADRGAGGVWPKSPVFGNINGKDWGTLTAKHLDHHLRQFGV